MSAFTARRGADSHMSKQPPHHPTDPINPTDPDDGRRGLGSTGHHATAGIAGTTSLASAGVDQVADQIADQIAGDPPVPITVWRTARTDGDRGSSIPTRLARRLVAAYSRPGETVVDLTTDHALTTACLTGTRRHHRAWFTDVASLIIGPATTEPGSPDTNQHLPVIDATGHEICDETGPDRPAAVSGSGPGNVPGSLPGSDAGTGNDPAADSGEIGLAVAAWFGDDLTDPALPPVGGPVTPIPTDASLDGRTSLVVATWPLDADAAPNRVRLAWLLTICQRLLRRGGCLVLVVAVPAGHIATPEDFSPIIDAAAQVGLGYLQHIVAVAADLRDGGDVFVYHLDDEELLTLSRARADADGEQWTVAHLRVHADLLVFTPALTPSGGRRGNAGTRRGGPGGETQHG